MNYLAHAFLSNNKHDLLIGNFIADHIRGNNFEGLNAGIIEGIKLHREIDAFTDDHTHFRKSKRLFYDGFERYSGILVDIYFDHFLAANFSQFSSLTLNEFSSTVYAAYIKSRNLMPSGSNRFLDYVITNNIYQTYSTEDGIEKVLRHLSQRIRHGIQLDLSLDLMKRNKQELNENFIRLFEDAVEKFKDH